MSNPAKLPGLPPVANAAAELARWISAATERMEVREGTRAGADEKTLLVRDLETLGLNEIGAAMGTGGRGLLQRRPDGSINFLDDRGLGDLVRDTPAYKDLLNGGAAQNTEVIAERVRQLVLQGLNDDESARKTDLAKLLREIGALNEESYFLQSGTGAVKRKYQSKLREQPVSVQDFAGYIVPAPTTPNAWYWDYTNPDNASQLQLVTHVPSTVSMGGSALVEGTGLIFRGDTSAQTPNAGLAESNMIRMTYEVKPAAGPRLQVHLINGLLMVGNDGNNSGNESASILMTTRSTGPIGGVSAVGAWAADFHVEKAAGVADGDMVGLEVGMHKAPSLGSHRNTGIDLWSGDRSGNIASRAGSAFQIHGTAGWTNYLRFLYTDQMTEVVQLNQFGNLVLRSPVTDQSTLITTNQPSTTATLQVAGYTSASANVIGILQAQAGGQVVLGSNSAHDFVLVRGNIELLRGVPNQITISSASGNQTLVVTSLANSTSGVLNIKGRDSAGNPVTALVDAQAGGQVTYGSVSPHDVVMLSGNAEVLRFVPSFIFSTPLSAQESAGSGTPLLGANCPAGTTARPTTWLRVRLSGGANGFIPVWV